MLAGLYRSSHFAELHRRRAGFNERDFRGSKDMGLSSADGQHPGNHVPVRSAFSGDGSTRAGAWSFFGIDASVRVPVPQDQPVEANCACPCKPKRAALGATGSWWATNQKSPGQAGCGHPSARVANGGDRQSRCHADVVASRRARVRG